MELFLALNLMWMELKKNLSKHPSMEGMDLTKSVTCKKSYSWNNEIEKHLMLLLLIMELNIIF